MKNLFNVLIFDSRKECTMESKQLANHVAITLNNGNKVYISEYGCPKGVNLYICVKKKMTILPQSEKSIKIFISDD